MDIRMRTCRRASSAAIAALAAGAMLLARSAGADRLDPKKFGPISWETSLPSAIKKATREHKPIFVDFWADSCGSCLYMLKTTYRDKAVIRRLSHFVPVLINAEDHPEVAKKFGVAQFPNMMVLTSSGKKVFESTGYESGKTFLGVLDLADRKLPRR